MLSHILKIMWNKRRAGTLVILEILLAFVVLLAVLSFLFYQLDRYRAPLGFSYVDVIGADVQLSMDLDSVAIVSTHQTIRNELLTIPGVEAVTWIGSILPFGGSSGTTTTNDLGFPLRTQVMNTDEYFAETVELNIREGQWFTEQDPHAKYPPMVVNKAFVDTYFPHVETLVDSILPINSDHRVIGVTSDFKYKGNFAENEPLAFFGPNEENHRNSYSTLLIRLSEGSSAALEETLYHRLTELTHNPNVTVWWLNDERVKANRPVVVPLAIMVVVSGFLLINTALGLFGVLFNQISQRRAEIGLRKVLGATPAGVTVQLVAEMMTLAVTGLIVGSFFALQLPLLNLLPIEEGYFYLAVVSGWAIILLIVVLCALIPSRQAAGLHPALVLHEQ